MKTDKFRRALQWCYASHGITVVSDRELSTNDNLTLGPIDVYDVHIEYRKGVEFTDFSSNGSSEGVLASQELANLKVQHDTVERLIASVAKCLGISIT
jgi:hypothetical protein